MISINNIKNIKTLASKNKIFMIRSKRDGRLGFIVNMNDYHVILKMENIEQSLKIDYETLSKGFGFIFSKRIGVLTWWAIKCRRGVLPTIQTEQDVYFCTIQIHDSICRYTSLISNHEIYNILKNYLNNVLNEQGKYQSAC